MKKLFFLATCSALVLSSCSNEIDETSEVPQINGAAEIRINTYAPGMTRAAVEKTRFVKNDKITVSAYCNDETLLDNKTYTFTEDADANLYWQTDEPANWPADPNATVSFYGAYSPDATATITNVDNQFSWDIEPTGDQDYMAAYVEEVSYGDNNGTVNLSFQHILSLLQINLQGTSSDYTYKATKVTLTAPKKATYYFNDRYVEPTRDEATETNEVIFNTFDLMKDIQVVEGTTSKEFAFNTNATDLTKVMVIPGGDTEYTLSVKYDYYYENEFVGTEEASGILYGLDAGQVYQINVKVGPESKEIIINASVAPWDKNTNIITPEMQ